jgi:hypothetical protein
LLPLLATLPALAAYAVLLPAGKWQGDEYINAVFVASDGWRAMRDRLTGWSPRPVAETLTWLYLAVSNALDRPLILPFLALLWAASLAVIAAAGYAGRLRQPVRLALLLFTLALLLAKPGEMFFWPMGAVAYLPCWAALAAVTVLHRAAPGRHGAALALAMLLAAFSAEIGALTVLAYAALVAAAGPGRGSLRPLILPALGGAAVCLLVLHGRMQPQRLLPAPGDGLAGNWAASLRAALPVFAQDSLGIAGLPLLAGAGVKLLLVLGLPQGPPASRPAARLALLWAGALLLGAFASIPLAYHEFGMLCCERHATLRQGMILLALATVAGLLGGAFAPARQAVLAALLLALLALRTPALLADWRDLTPVEAARDRNWTAGQAAGDSMVFRLVTPGRIVNDDALPPGAYHRTPDGALGQTPWYAWGIMARFGKHALTIVPPSP